jgi:pimeloyl-ACP methyl ester carboxylesterase
VSVDVFVPAEAGELLPVTVVCHGFKGFKDWGLFPPLAERLAANGRAVVTFNFSHNGIGDVPDEFTRLDLFREQTIGRHVEDLGLVMDAVTDGRVGADLNLQRNQHFNVVGHSLGAAVAILRAADDGRIVQVSTMNGIAHFDRFGPDVTAQLEANGEVLITNARTGQEMPLGRAWFDDADEHDLEQAATMVFVPTLILQGAADANVTPEEGQQLNAWIAGSRLVEVPDGDHVFGAAQPFVGWTPALEAVARELDDFLPHVGRLGGI